MPFTKEARLRLLGVTSPRRSPFLPEVPAIAEELPGYVFESWFGLLAPARTPGPVIERINAEVAKKAELRVSSKLLNLARRQEGEK